MFWYISNLIVKYTSNFPFVSLLLMKNKNLHDCNLYIQYSLDFYYHRFFYFQTVSYIYSCVTNYSVKSVSTHRSILNMYIEWWIDWKIALKYIVNATRVNMRYDYFYKRPHHSQYHICKMISKHLKNMAMRI